MSRATPFVIGLLAVSTPVFVSSCARDEGAGGRRGGSRPNVLLVTLDTTRADHIGAYGWRHAFTPTLDALAKKSVKFNRAFSPVPVTLPSHATILTGLYPFYHGVRDNAHFVLDPGVKTVAETLHESGYRTAAIVAAFVLDARFGLDQGFDAYDDEVRPASEFAAFHIPERNAAAVTDAAIDWLDSAGKDRPFFLWVHYYDPHSDYNAPDSFTKYQGHPYDVEIAYTDSELGRLLDHMESLAPGGRRALTVVTADHGEALGQYGEPTHAYFAYDSTLHVPLLIRMPDGSHAGEEIDVPVGLADLVPTILDALELPVPGPDEIHGRSLLPLIRTGKAPLDLTDRPIALECYEPHYGYGWAPVRGVRVGERKFIDAPQPELYLLSENPEEIPTANQYTRMPELAAELEAAYHELFESELAFPPSTATPQPPDPDTLEKLRSLGYSASSLRQRPGESGGKDLKEMLPFYRRVLHAMGLVSSGNATVAVEVLLALLNEEPSNERVLWMLAELAATTPYVADDVLPVLEEALAQSHVPSAMVQQTWVNCGRGYLAKNDNWRALECFSKAQKNKRDYPAPYWWLGLTYLRLDRRAEAIEAMGRAADLFGPEVERTRIVLGLVLFADGQHRKAAREWGRLLDREAGTDVIWRVADGCPLDPAIAERVCPALQHAAGDRTLPPRVRAVVSIVCSNYLSATGDHEQALAALEDARALLPENDAGLLLRLGELELRLNHTARARDRLEHAHRVAPDRIDITGTLAGAMEQGGDIDAAVKLLNACYQAHPDNLTATNNLAWILARQGQDLDRALKLAKRAVNRQPGNATVTDTIGWVYHVRGDREMAVRYLTRATRTDPQNATYHYHLAVACRQAGRLEQAREAFARAVELAPTPRPNWYDEARAASGDR